MCHLYINAALNSLYLTFTQLKLTVFICKVFFYSTLICSVPVPASTEKGTEQQGLGKAVTGEH
jgi:hypothetical protein